MGLFDRMKTTASGIGSSLVTGIIPFSLMEYILGDNVKEDYFRIVNIIGK